MSFRHGQWVKTSTVVPGAHVDPDGKTIGIYQHGRDPGATMDGKPVDGFPAHVCFPKPDGTNLMRLSDDGNTVVKVAIDPKDLADLEEVVEHDHLPESRKIPDAPLGHKLGKVDEAPAPIVEAPFEITNDVAIEPLPATV